jgi:hypothetical protein
MKNFGAPSVRDILKVALVCAVAGVRNSDVAVISRVSADNSRINFFDKFNQEYWRHLCRYKGIEEIRVLV